MKAKFFFIELHGDRASVSAFGSQCLLFKNQFMSNFSHEELPYIMKFGIREIQNSSIVSNQRKAPNRVFFTDVPARPRSCIAVGLNLGHWLCGKESGVVAFVAMIVCQKSFIEGHVHRNQKLKFATLRAFHFSKISCNGF